MYHYTYKVSIKSGKYYVGRHSTKRLNDGYIGSGKWIKSLKNKESIIKEILSFYDNFEDLKIAESKLIKEHINEINCMNFNNNSIGFAYGDLNPSKTQNMRKIMSERIKGNKNPSKREEVRLKMSLSQKGKPSMKKGIKRTEEEKRRMAEGRIGLKYSIEGRRKLSESRKKQYENGERKIPSFKNLKHTDEYKNIMREKSLNREKITCIFCNNNFKPHTFKRWHGENCKRRID